MSSNPPLYFYCFTIFNLIPNISNSQYANFVTIAPTAGAHRGANINVQEIEGFNSCIGFKIDPNKTKGTIYDR